MSIPSGNKTLRLLIHGRVQGVFFRESMRVEADRLSVAGWVRNLGDGSVEAAVQGEPAAVDAIVRWAHRGPPMASVERVVIEVSQGEFDGFQVLRS